METSSGSTTGASTGAAPGASMGNSGGQTVGDPVSQVTGQVTQVAGQVMDQARDQIKSQLHDQKDRAAGQLGTVAQALRQTGQQLRQKDEAALVGQYAEQAAQWVEEFSGRIREKNVDEMLEDLSGFARRQPGVFLGGAFMLGFLAARFLKSSAQNEGGSTSIQRSYSSDQAFTGYGQGAAYRAAPYQTSRERPLKSAYEHAMEETSPTGTQGTRDGIGRSDYQVRAQPTSGYSVPTATESVDVPVHDESEETDIPVSHGSQTGGTGGYGI